MTRTAAPAIPTLVAAARWGDNLYCGHSVDRELAGKASTWAAMALAVGHPGLSADDTLVLDDLVVCALAADPRIWPLKITRLLSAYGHVTAGTIAGMYCTEQAPIGWRAYFTAAEFLMRLSDQADRRARRLVIDGLLERREYVPGYGVAFRPQDERAIAFGRCLRARGRDRGQYWQLAIEADAALSEKRVRMNMGAAGAAAMLDLGFTPAQMYALGPYLVFPNYLANAVEGAEQAPQALRKLPVGALDDRTPPSRQSPRASPTAHCDAAGSCVPAGSTPRR